MSGQAVSERSRASAPSADLAGGFAARDTFAAVADAARAGLLRKRKRLPPWLFYDDEGSALFEEITRLPEYYLTRTERAILTTHAEGMLEAAGNPREVVELGAGSASKTRVLLAALRAQKARARYVPVDVSPAALAHATLVLRDLRHVDVRPAVARYPEELSFLRRPVGGRRLVLFLGSNVGNYDPRRAVELLAAVRGHLSPGDGFLMGVDRRKSPALLLPAYDDAAGVTARFNKNMLTRLNRELGATFDLDRFRHVVAWNARASRLELSLESAVAQRVVIDALGARVDFAAGERIHTESSYKLTDARVRQLFERAGFVPETTWTDEARLYGVHLARVPLD
ncbi:MAG TPA: L-histidine N(alpha)-methyltransferase [Polyangia bacterium]|jgi:L-histidine N-alpha-methyltransferase|nr:L-histidine N(alpha)-methyltransferase [Polyangia bacterium]